MSDVSFGRSAHDCIDRIEQRSIRKWLQQAFDCPALAQTTTKLLVAMGRNKNDWYLPALLRQLALELNSGHARHCDVEDQALGSID
ncbi:hypothetical protein ACVWWD_005679 [Mesorhizobium sp. URHB0026]|nr:hypothetical protein X741_27805 [Mesorhizobium sp. LNHC229A00]